MKLDRAGSLAHDPHDRSQSGGLARSIATNQGQHFALTDIEVHAVQYLGFVIPAVQVLHYEAGFTRDVTHHRYPPYKQSLHPGLQRPHRRYLQRESRRSAVP